MPDLMAALDAVIARGIVDERRLGATGGSQGGFLVNWIIGQTNRFAAGITQRCISNWVSDYGTSDLSMVSCDQEFGGPPWEAMETYLRLSPLTYVGNMKTPLHIEQQEHDYRCAMEQAEQMFMALKARDVPVEFVRYPNESHAMSRSGQPHHRIERLNRHLAWFARNTWEVEPRETHETRKRRFLSLSLSVSSAPLWLGFPCVQRAAPAGRSGGSGRVMRTASAWKAPALSRRPRTVTVSPRISSDALAFLPLKRRTVVGSMVMTAIFFDRV